jgi:hypothetical protein
MPLRFLFDENLRGALWTATLQHNAVGVNPLEAVCVGDSLDLPLGASDPDVLLWSERETRVLVTLDKTTMPGHLNQHLQAGRHSPGVMVLRHGYSVPRLVAFRVLAAYASDPLDWQDQVQFIP